MDDAPAPFKPSNRALLTSPPPLKRIKLTLTRPFRYDVCTDRLAEAGDTPLVSVVKFQIARGKTRTTDGVVASVRFGEKLLSLAAAVAAAERQLSQPLTPEVFCAVREELALSSGQSFDEAKERYACVGACLHGAIYLEGVVLDEGVATLVCGF